MNCLQKELEMDLDLVWIFGPKEMGWFGGTAEDLPERDFRRDQYLAGLDRWSDLEQSCRVYVRVPTPRPPSHFESRGRGPNCSNPRIVDIIYEVGSIMTKQSGE